MFSSEPDISIIKEGQLQIAVEVKGGIDTSGVLERVGAAIKSLKRAKEENAITILIMQGAAFSSKAQKDIELSKDVIDYFFLFEKMIAEEETREDFFRLLNF